MLNVTLTLCIFTVGQAEPMKSGHATPRLNLAWVAEGRFTYIGIDDLLNVSESWRYAGIFCSMENPAFVRQWAQTRRLETMVKDRTIVNRFRKAKIPTWDGLAESFIIEPTIWYFDPTSRVQDPGIKLWDPTVLVTDTTTRQTVGEFWLNGFHRYEPSRFSFGTNYLFR